MTAINLCFRGSQAFIATDTAVSSRGHGIIGHKSKCLALPHARVAIACSGPVSVSSYFLFDTFNAYDVVDVIDLVSRAPRVFRDAWSEYANDVVPFNAFLAGIDRTDAAKAFLLSSAEGFEPIALQPGIFMFPLLKEIKAEVIAESEGRAVPTRSSMKQEDIPWHKLTQSCVAFLDEQAAENPDAVGGHVECTLIQPEGIQQTRLRPIFPGPATILPDLNVPLPV